MARKDHLPSGRRRAPAGPARWSRRVDRPPGTPTDFALLQLDSIAPSPVLPPCQEAHALHRVLIVDEDDFGREALGQILEADGYCVEAAAGTDEALECLGGPVPDLIVVNLLTPGQRWRRFVRRLRRDPLWRDVPLIVVSAEGGSVGSGIAAHFVKPIEVDALRAAIRELLPS